ncbi:polyketide synthase for naphthopyrone YWA1 [Podospora didyma]|uniref:Polyketide synthase for naphthopyrone YWA1 n=1 Tax=Podospora didyma TaxID=330526 RepID=A0AAE0U0X4_9PEZI|nr:polyketide synthase for naphthopyrone YWA1 [Podospora didyma]
MDPARLLLFGDQTNDFAAGLQELLRFKDNALLLSFMDKIHAALRHEISQQSREVQESLPRFSGVADILAAYSTHLESAPVLASTLATIYQLGSIISYYGDGSKSYPEGHGVAVLGMCTGLTAASAVASASTVSQLVPLAVQAVVVAFRIGLHVAMTRDHLEKGPLRTKSWSYLVPGLDLAAASTLIEQFSESTNIPPSSRPYVGIVGPSSVTVCGRPSVLREFLNFPAMAPFKAAEVPIFAPYHTAALHSEADIQKILHIPHQIAKATRKLPIISSITGEAMSATTFRSLLEISLAEILLKPTDWSKLVKSAYDSCELSSFSRCVVSAVGANAVQSLVAGIRETKGGEHDLKVEIEHLTRSPHHTERRVGSSGRQEHSKIAIIGFSGRFPEAADPDGLWRLVHEGRDVHREIPVDRFDVDAHYDATGKKKNTSQVRHGCFINEPGLFDCSFFSLSPKEAEQSDPGQRLALLTAYEALEMAGVVPDRTPSTQRDRVGVFYGVTSDDWREVNSGQNVGTYFIPGGNRAFIPGRINYHFKFSGPSVSVDTACSSSAAAIHMACNSLWRNDCDTAIAGGTNVMTNPDNFAGLDRGHFLSRTGSCKTFDDGADGYCRADAVGTVVLKRLEDALADGDHIQGVICGAYTNHSAEAESITRPHIGAQSAIFRRILSDAGHDSLDVSYIEMHGTGTQAGDAVEMRSVLDVFAGSSSGRPEGKPLYLGSIKSNVGHSESASGVTSLIKLLLMMKNNEIPPHCGIKTKLNTKFPTDLARRGIRIAMEPTDWKRPDQGSRMAFLNNFSAAGGNSALLVEDAPPSPLRDSDVASSSPSKVPRDIHLITVSARTAKSLRKNIDRLAEFLRLNPAVNLVPSIAYTTTARRMHHNHRVAVCGRTGNDLRVALEQSAALDARPIPRKPPQVAFAFTGQGSQYYGMGEHLASSFSVFREEIYRLDRIAINLGFESFMPLIFSPSLSSVVSESTTNVENFSPLVTQLGLTCFQIALARLWSSLGVTPSVVVGHSLGEYAALCVAGVLSAHDTVFLVGTRARIMQNLCREGTHAMLAVNAPLASLGSFLQTHRDLEVACINGPAQTVLAGPIADVHDAFVSLAASGIKSTKLHTNFAFHSSQVAPVLDEFEHATRAVVFHKPQVPVTSPLLATVVTDEGHLNGKYLARHCREKVDFAGAVQHAISQEVLSEKTICLEIGPDPVVTRLLKANISPSTRALASVRKTENLWATLGGTLTALYLAGVDIQWDGYHRDSPASSKQVIALPAYQWDYKNHWIPYAHNWCLTKGDAPSSAAQSPSPTQTFSGAPEVRYEFLSATCQKVISSTKGSKASSVLMESDISHPDLRSVFEAHKVNGAILCPSSVYADIALTLGSYLLRDENNPAVTTPKRVIDVADMVTSKPLLMSTPGGSQLFRASAEADWTTQTATVVFYSVNSAGKKTIQHATCTLHFGNADEWLSSWKRSAYLVQARVQSLRDSAIGQGACHFIKRGMAYKLFENCVEYGPQFQGIEEVCLDSIGHEATARVVFKDSSACFHTNPYRIDSLGHLSGFVMNATESFDYKTNIFINHGWRSMRLAAPLSADQSYDTYVKMQLLDGTRYSGDVYIFQGGEIIGLIEGVVFQAVPRKVLDLLLPRQGAIESGGVSTKPAHESRPAVVSEKAYERPLSETIPKPSASVRKDNTADPSVVSEVLKIVAEETGVSITEMGSHFNFADGGVDSLLSLAICGRLREELNMDVKGTFFLDNPTVKDLKRVLEVNNPNPTWKTSESTSSSSSIAADDEVVETPSSSATSVNADNLDEQPKSDPISILSTIIAEEVGVLPEDVWNAPSLADLGLDSLMSLTILGRLREELDLDLPADILLLDNIQSIRKQLQQVHHEDPLTLLESTPIMSVVSASSSPPPHMDLIPKATSVVLQGNPKTASKTLFLFPDGSGSATSYATLPKIAPDVAVVGLNCPFMKRPEDLKNCALQDLTAPYLAEIRRRQPRGPYYLGGWSAGGICAYDASQVLMAVEGEEVAALVLLDSPNPIGLAKLPVRLYHFLNSLNMFGDGSSSGGEPPEWLLPHFIAFIDALARYKPKPFVGGGPHGKAPMTYAIWAADGVYTSSGGKRLEEQPDDTREMEWLLNDRTEPFGPNGWDQLVGRDRMRNEVLRGANHFTMMRGQQGVMLSMFIARALGV